MNTNKRIVVSSDHADIELRKKIAAHIAAQGWEVIDIGPTDISKHSLSNPRRSCRSARRIW